METPIKKSNTGKTILIVVIIVIVLGMIGWGIYREFFQFNQKDVADYIKEETDLYPTDKQASVAKIIQDGVNSILADKNKVRQVLDYSSLNGTPKEQELVHMAIMDAKGYGYIS